MNVDVARSRLNKIIGTEGSDEILGTNPENTAGEWVGDGETRLNIKIKNLGYKFAFNGKGIIYHIIPSERMKQSYLNGRLYNQGNCDSFILWSGK